MSKLEIGGIYWCAPSQVRRSAAAYSTLPERAVIRHTAKVEGAEAVIYEVQRRLGGHWFDTGDLCMDYDGEDASESITPISRADGSPDWEAAVEKMIRRGHHPAAWNDDGWIEEWRQEIAREAGMLGGCDAYNEVMGY